MEGINFWFRKEVLRWRNGASLTWGVISLPPILLVYLLISKIQFYHPLLWLTDVTNAVFSTWTIVLVFIVMFICGLLALYSSTQFTVLSNICLIRLEIFTNYLKGARLVHSFIYICGGGIMSSCCIKLSNKEYSSFSMPCSYTESEITCFNEYHLFIVLHGMYAGMMYHIFFYQHKFNYIAFPDVHQSKFFRVKSTLLSLLIRSTVQIFWQIKFFYLLYYLCSFWPRHFVALSLKYQISDEVQLNSIFGLLNMKLFVQTMLCGITIHFSWSVFAMLKRIYSAEHFVFTIESFLEQQNNKCLHNAMSCQSLPILQYLGFLDLYLLTSNDVMRRKHLLSLSQPGGYPRNWDRIIGICLPELEALNAAIQEHNWRAFTNIPVRHQGVDIKQPTATVLNGDYSSKNKIQASKPLTTSERLVSSLAKHSMFSYFLRPLPDAASRHLFASVQKHIWIVDALSNIVVASYAEDSFGIVQKSLPSILSCILTLQESVDKHFKLATNIMRRNPHDMSVTSDIALRYSIRSHIHSSLYKIVDTFRLQLDDIKLPEEHARKLGLYIQYKDS